MRFHAKYLIWIFATFIFFAILSKFTLLRYRQLDSFLLQRSRMSRALLHKSDIDNARKLMWQPNAVKENARLDIHIVAVIDETNDLKNYEIAIESLQCYAAIEKYPLSIVRDSAEWRKLCPAKDFLFRRHCIVAHLLVNHKWTLMLDADIGVVNPKHRIEEWIDDRFNLIMFDRFYNWEMFIAEQMLDPLPPPVHLDCGWLWNNSRSYTQLTYYEACIRQHLGEQCQWPGKLKILGKARGSVRDGWLTGNRWAPDDFMFHGWKKYWLPEEPTGEHGNLQSPFNASYWFDQSACARGEFNWPWKKEMMIDQALMDTELAIMETVVKREQKEAIEEMNKRLKLRL